MRNEVTILEKCLGLSAVTELQAAVNHTTGECELRECSGIDLTSTGKIIAEPQILELESCRTTGQQFVSISSFSRVIVQLGIYVYVLVDNALQQVTYEGLPIEVTGVVKFLHTYRDIRFVSDNILYVLPTTETEVVVATYGVYGGPRTSAVFDKMPAISNGFVYGGRVYLLDGEFLRYSEQWYYDCFDLGNGYISLLSTGIAGAAIQGIVCILCSDKLVLLKGTSPKDFVYSEYPIIGFANSLTTGYSDKLGNILCFTGPEGIYIVGTDGVPVNVSREKLTINHSSCVSAVIKNNNYYKVFTGKDSYTYDLNNNAVLTSFNVSPIGVCKLNGNVYAISEFSFGLYQQCDVAHVSIRLPLITASSAKGKRIRRLKLFGTFLGAMLVTVSGNHGRSISQSTLITTPLDVVEVTGFGKVSGEFLDISIQFECTLFELTRIAATMHITAS